MQSEDSLESRNGDMDAQTDIIYLSHSQYGSDLDGMRTNYEPKRL